MKGYEVNTRHILEPMAEKMAYSGVSESEICQVASLVIVQQGDQHEIR